MWTIFKPFIELVTILIPFYVLIFGCKACEILAPQPGIKPKPPALEGLVLTTGLPGKSLQASCPSIFHPSDLPLIQALWESWPCPGQSDFLLCHPKDV